MAVDGKVYDFKAVSEEGLQFGTLENPFEANASVVFEVSPDAQGPTIARFASGWSCTWEEIETVWIDDTHIGADTSQSGKFAVLYEMESTDGSGGN